MKSILKIVFLGIVIAVVWNFLDRNNINVKDHLTELLAKIQSGIEELAESSGNNSNEETINRSREVSAENESSNTVIHSNQISSGSSENSNSDYQGNEVPEIQEQDTETNDKSEYVDYSSKEENVEWVKSMTEKLSPDSWYLLMQYDKLPSEVATKSVSGSSLSTRKSASTFEYLSGRSKTELLQSMGTNVHEIAHGYFRQNTYKYAKENGILMNWDNSESFFLVSPTLSYFISFPNKSLFPSRELIKVIPENLRTFRFDTYIDGTSSTQSEGVIGLLNEMHAYYLGSKFDFEMLNAYKQAAGNEAEGLFSWVSGIQSSMTAYYEFDYFIKEYLLYMKETRPEDYELLKSYRQFGEAYRTVSKAYKALIEKYQETIQGEMKRINDSGMAEVRIEKGKLWVTIKGENSGSGTTVFSEEKELLEKEIESEKYGMVKLGFGLEI